MLFSGFWMASHRIDFSSYSRIHFGSLDFLCLPGGDVVRLHSPSDNGTDSIKMLMGDLCLNDDGMLTPMATHMTPQFVEAADGGLAEFVYQSLSDFIPGLPALSDVDSDATTWGSGDDLNAYGLSAREALFCFMRV